MTTTTISASHSLPRWTAPQRWLRIEFTHLLPLIVILVLQTVLALQLQNSAHQDEGLYIQNGRAIVEDAFGEPINLMRVMRHFSGYALIYPPLAGLVDMIGGLYAVRAVSLVFMLIATLCVYYIGKHLFNQNVGYLSAAIFALQPSVLFLSHLATFDAMSLSMLAISTVFALKASTSGRLSALILCGIFLFLGMTTKYAGLLFVPTVLAILSWQSFEKLGFVRAVVNVMTVGIVVALCGVLVVVITPDLLLALSATTTQRQAQTSADRLTIIVDIASKFGLPIVLGFISLLLVPYKQLPLALVLWGTALLAPAYHVYKAETVSMDKHLAFGMSFAAPVIGYVLAWLGGYERDHQVGRRWFIPFGIFLFVFSLSFSQVQGLFSWGNADEAVRALNTLLRPNGRILTDEPETLIYPMGEISEGVTWVNMIWFEYWSNGTHYQDLNAYQQALNDSYFDVIALGLDKDDGYIDYVYEMVVRSPNYELVYTIPNWGWSRSNMMIWRRTTQAPNT